MLKRKLGGLHATADVKNTCTEKVNLSLNPFTIFTADLSRQCTMQA